MGRFERYEKRIQLSQKYKKLICVNPLKKLNFLQLCRKRPKIFAWYTYYSVSKDGQILVWALTVFVFSCGLL